MNRTSSPAPYNRQPAFVEHSVQEIPVTLGGETHTIIVRASHRGNEVLDEAKESGDQPGDLPIGKFAKNCTGVSVVRAGRELCLSQEWTIPYDPVERWWGVEIIFEPALDEILGVSNDKQQASNIRLFGVSEYAAENNLSKIEALDAIEEEYASGDPTVKVQINISKAVHAALAPIRLILKKQRVGVKKDIRVTSPTSAKATQHLNDRGSQEQTDRYKTTPRNQREAANAKMFQDNGATPESAAQRARTIEDNQSRAEIELVDFDNLELFDSTLKNGFYYIRVNSGHPAIKAMIDAQSSDVSDLEESTIVSNLKLLFLTYADMEAKSGPEDRANQRDVRLHWGQEAYRMFK